MPLALPIQLQPSRSAGHRSITIATGPNGKRGVFGWPEAALAPGSGLMFEPGRQADRELSESGGALLIATSRDNRADFTVQLTSRNGQDQLGVARVWCSCGPQPHVIPITSSAMARLAKEGGRLVRDDDETETLWLLNDSSHTPSLPPCWQPRLIANNAGVTDPAERATAWLLAGGVMQSFGWRSGCVLDALHSVGTPAASAAIDRMLDEFVDADGEPFFDQWDNTRGRPERLGAESGLAVASFVQQAPHRSAEQPFVAWARRQWETGLDNEGVYTDAETTAAEGAYMTAYPWAVAALDREDQDALDLAIHQLAKRAERLWDGENLWLRHHPDRGRTLASWARGVAWHVLGFVKTLRVVPETQRPEQLLAHAREVLAWAFGFQHPDGLWPNLFRQPSSLPDTSGSAGIAAAALLAVQQGWGDHALIDPAQRAVDALHTHIDTLGLLHGCAPDNMLGQPLLETDYRVTHPAGPGLYLTACLASQTLMTSLEPAS